MNYIAGILTVFIVVNCLILILLVLIQLPKKDAGAGLAFGGGAADALFGAGSGNALTKITKWATGIFFVLALALGYVEEQLHSSNTASFEKALQQQQSQMPAPSAQMPPTTPLQTTPTTPLQTTPTMASNAPVTSPGEAPGSPIPAGTNSMK
jgi:preprotein translocase subunit SecG